MQKAWPAWTFVDFGQKSSVQDGRGEGGGAFAATDCACVGFGAIWAGGFLPVEAAGGWKTVACAYFAAAELACILCRPRVMICIP